MTAGQATIALKTVGEIVDRFATLAPTEAVITTIDREGDEDAISRQMLSAWSDGLAQALVDAGVGVGDLVPIHLPTGNAFIAAAVGIFKAGGTPMPVSDRLPDAELSHLLDLADAKVVLSNTLTTVNRIDVDSLRNESLAENSQGAIAPPRQVHVSNPTKALASGGSTGKPKLIVTTGDALFDPENPIIPM